jgi:predicted small lipoprotein YifL
MKKVYVAGLLLTVASLTGCTIKGPTIPEISTGDAQSVL